MPTPPKIAILGVGSVSELLTTGEAEEGVVKGTALMPGNRVRRMCITSSMLDKHQGVGVCRPTLSCALRSMPDQDREVLRPGR
jgi:hypothetical protein